MHIYNCVAFLTRQLSQVIYAFGDRLEEIAFLGFFIDVGTSVTLTVKSVYQGNNPNFHILNTY